MKNLELKKLGVAELNVDEMNTIYGGAEAAAFPWVALITQITAHWSEIKTGFNQGFQKQI